MLYLIKPLTPQACLLVKSKPHSFRVTMSIYNLTLHISPSQILLLSLDNALPLLWNDLDLLASLQSFNSAHSVPITWNSIFPVSLENSILPLWLNSVFSFLWVIFLWYIDCILLCSVRVHQAIFKCPIRQFMIFVIYLPISSTGFEKCEGSVVTTFYYQCLLQGTCIWSLDKWMGERMSD